MSTDGAASFGTVGAEFALHLRGGSAELEAQVELAESWMKQGDFDTAVEQFREEYVFLSPNKYLEDYINIVASVGAQVQLDGVNISAASFTLIGGTGYMVARLKVADGVVVPALIHLR